MGIPVDCFDDPNINEGFLCTICQDVLQEVTMLNPCEHAFCKVCIEQWQQNSKTCPIDRQLVEGFKKPPRIYMTVLNGLQLRCPFKDRGCETRLVLGDLSSHLSRCTFSPDYEKLCGGGCGAVLKRGQAEEHNCVDHLRRQLWSTEQELQKSEAEVETLKYELYVTKEELKSVKQELDKARGRTDQISPITVEVNRSEPSPTSLPKPAQPEPAKTIRPNPPPQSSPSPRPTTNITKSQTATSATKMSPVPSAGGLIRCSYKADYVNDRVYKEMMDLISLKLQSFPQPTASTPADRLVLQKMLEDALKTRAGAFASIASSAQIGRWQIKVVGKLSAEGLAEPDKRDVLILAVGNTKIRIWAP